MKALVLVNGELNKLDVLQRRIKAESFDLVLGADNGARFAEILKVKLDAVIGDMDSLSEPERKEIVGVKYISYPAGKNETDLELALLYAKVHGADSIVMVGAMGGRIDMTISNILLITNEKLSSCRIEVWDGEQTAWLIRPPGEDIFGQPGDTISFIPLGGYASGITNYGLKYPLQNAVLTQGSPRGVSNLLEKSPARIEFREGLLLAVQTPGKA